MAHWGSRVRHDNPSAWRLAVCLRDQVAALAVVNGEDIIEVRRRRLRDGPAGETPSTFLFRGVLDLAADYATRRIIVEPGTGLVRAIDRSWPELQIEHLTVQDAKHRLLGHGNRTHEMLFKQILAVHPKLTRLVTVFSSTGRIAMSERRRTVCLLAVALGLAAGNNRTNGTTDCDVRPCMKRYGRQRATGTHTMRTDRQRTSDEQQTI